LVIEADIILSMRVASPTSNKAPHSSIKCEDLQPHGTH
jgi:hypothetical protein